MYVYYLINYWNFLVRAPAIKKKSCENGDIQKSKRRNVVNSTSQKKSRGNNNNSYKCKFIL